MKNIVDEIISRGGELLRELVIEGVRARLGGEPSTETVMAYIRGVQDGGKR